jgi:hypothetical protein
MAPPTARSNGAKDHELRKYNTPAARAQLSPLVKKSEHFFDLSRRRAHVKYRSETRVQSPGHAFALFDARRRTATMFFGPGENIYEKSAQTIAAVARSIIDPGREFDRLELEFSTTPACLYPSATGLPEDYLPSAVKWALTVCSSILVCVAHELGTATGESHRIESPVQAVFHCSQDQRQIWADYLAKRMQPWQTLTIVEMGAGS